MIPKGQTGGLVIFDDRYGFVTHSWTLPDELRRPAYWDAWDTEIYSLETPVHLKFAKVQVAETGPIRASLKAEVKIGTSTLVNVTVSGFSLPRRDYIILPEWTDISGRNSRFVLTPTSLLPEYSHALLYSNLEKELEVLHQVRRGR